METADAGAQQPTALADRQRRAARAARRQQTRRRVAKRAFDLVVGPLLLIAAVPVVLVIALASSLALRAWPFFAQERPGREGAPFRIVKVRTLPRTVPGYGHKDDLTREMADIPWVCRVLRRSHLDELPQLALVLTGRMSLVGPRPSQPLQYEHIDDTFEWMRTAVRPGCTGLWQIGTAHELALDADPEFDTFYLEHMSLRLDAWILVRTLLLLPHVVGPVSTAAVPRWVLGRRNASRPTPGRSGTSSSAVPVSSGDRG